MKLLVASFLLLNILKLVDQVIPVAKPFQFLRSLFAEALEFTIGNPSQERHGPPLIGPQPYRDKPGKLY